MRHVLTLNRVLNLRDDLINISDLQECVKLFCECIFSRLS